MRTVVCALAMLLLSSNAMSQRVGNVSTLSSMKNCGQYLEARRSNSSSLEHFIAYQWGYLSAYNVYGTKPQIDIPDRPTMLAFFDQYCGKNPLHTLSQGTVNLIAELGGYRP